jgi:hypothetical protein
VELAKVTKLLLASKRGIIAKYKGMSLAEIDLGIEDANADGDVQSSASSTSNIQSSASSASKPVKRWRPNWVESNENSKDDTHTPSLQHLL